MVHVAEGSREAPQQVGALTLVSRGGGGCPTHNSRITEINGPVPS